MAYPCPVVSGRWYFTHSGSADRWESGYLSDSALSLSRAKNHTTAAFCGSARIDEIGEGGRCPPSPIFGSSEQRRRVYCSAVSGTIPFGRMEVLWRSLGVSTHPSADPSATDTPLRRARRQSGEQARPRRGLREALQTTRQTRTRAQEDRPEERRDEARLPPRQSPKRPIGCPEAIPTLHGPAARPQPTRVGHPGCSGAPR